jgi:hypothetical protein
MTLTHIKYAIRYGKSSPQLATMKREKKREADRDPTDLVQ